MISWIFIIDVCGRLDRKCWTCFCLFLVAINFSTFALVSL
jgi:hypothetical protein